MYSQATDALFATGEVPTMFMIIKDGEAEVIPPAPVDVPMRAVAELVASYANIREAQYTAFLSMCFAVRSS